MTGAPLIVEFIDGTSLLREQDRASDLPIVGNGPPGTFVVFPNRFRVSLPTDQIVAADDDGGRVRVGFGGMRFDGLVDGRLVCQRVREMLPEERLSPARSRTMLLDARLVASVRVDGRIVWEARLAG